MNSLTPVATALRAHDIHQGLHGAEIDRGSAIIARNLETTQLVGMAGALASWIKGREVVEDAQELKVVASEQLDIDPWAFDRVLGVLQELDQSRGDPTHVPWTPPGSDADLGRAIDWLLELNTPDIHFGLPGGTRIPEFCRANKVLCKVTLLAVGGIAGALLIGFGGPEGLEEQSLEPPEAGDEAPGSRKPQVLR